MEIGTRLLIRKNKKELHSGVVVESQYSETADYITVWFKSTSFYGDINCEHYTQEYSKEFTIIDTPFKFKNSSFHIGKLLNTKYGKGIVVDFTYDTLTIYLYNQDNTFTPDNNYNDNFLIDDKGFINQDDPLFNKGKHCIELPILDKSILDDYILA